MRANGSVPEGLRRDQLSNELWCRSYWDHDRLQEGSVQFYGMKPELVGG